MNAIGHGGFLAFLAVFVGGAIQLLKTDRLNSMLAKFSIPPAPKRLLPWLAVLLGYILALSEAILRGEPTKSALVIGLYGIMSGASAVGGDQTVGKLFSKSSTPKPTETSANESPAPKQGDSAAEATSSDLGKAVEEPSVALAAEDKPT